MITDKYYRITPERTQVHDAFNWFFLPGGLGFGSEYLLQLIACLDIEDNVYRLDFPDDGSNRLSQAINFDAIWEKGLLQCLSRYKNAILVTHSVSSMLALTIPNLEKVLSGMVIIASSPSDI